MKKGLCTLLAGAVLLSPSMVAHADQLQGDELKQFISSVRGL